MGTSLAVMLAVGVLPAVAFAFAYGPITARLARGFVSPYGKADVRRRLLAATADAIVVMVLGVLSWTTGLIAYGVVGGAYLLLRDGIRGQGIGKFFFGLVAIDLETGRPSAMSASVRRNALLLLPGANAVALFLEARTIIRDPQGQRLGDRLAQTQVVDGLGAKDLVKAFQEWLMGLGSAIGRSAGDRPRTPAGIDRRRPAA